MNNETKTTTCVEEVMENYDVTNELESTNTKKTIFKLGIFAAVAGIVITVLRKTKEKRIAWMNNIRIKKLEKQGYTVMPPFEDDIDVETESE
jgi:hypothetical protein